MEKSIRSLLKLSTYRHYYKQAKFKTKTLLKKQGPDKPGGSYDKAIQSPIAREVEDYYDKETDMYLATYGTIIQAARPASDTDFIHYLSDSMALVDGLHILDAGCGVCGPAVAFAKHKKVFIEGITISEVQVGKAKQHILENGLSDSINVVKGDYSELGKQYPGNTFDLVYFLETLGYANDMQKVLTGAVKVLKQGGSVYIKDFFLVPVIDPEQKKVQHEFTENVRKEYLYRVLNLSTLIPLLREAGLYIEFIKPVGISEDFTRAAEFEIANRSHSIYTRAIHYPFQLFEVLELKFKKVYN